MIRRRAEKVSEGEKMWQAVKKHKLGEFYHDESIPSLVKKRKEQGWYYEDLSNLTFIDQIDLSCDLLL